MFHFLSFVLTCSTLIASVWSEENYYCANIGVTVGGSVPNTNEGYFAMKIGDGYAKYSFSVDLSGTDACDFNTYPTVSYHIHTYSITNPSANPQTACGNAAGHYDPNLACGEKSQSHSTLCNDIQRTSADGYTYSCSTTGATSYADPTGGCEVGDLSGKFGKLTLTNGVASSTQVYTDYLPAYAYNYNNPTVNITSGWASIVFHCGDSAGTRIACGDFALTTTTTSTTTNANCDFTSTAWVNNEQCEETDDGVNVSQSEYNTVIAFLVLGWAIAVINCLLILYYFYKKKKNEENTSMMRSAV